MADSVSIPLVTQDKDLEAQDEGLPISEERPAKGLSLASKERMVFYARRFFCLLLGVALFVGLHVALWHFYVWLFAADMHYLERVFFSILGAIPIVIYLSAIIAGLEEWGRELEEEKRRKQEGTVEAV